MDYEKIKILKTFNDYHMNGINYGQVISSRLYSNSWYSFFVSIVQGLFMKPSIDFSIKRNHRTLISYNIKNLKRKDYAFMINILKEIVTDYDLILIDRKVSINILKNLINIYGIVRKMSNKNFNYFEKLQVASLITYYSRYDEILNKVLNFDYNCYISFCDSYLDENMITQWIRKTHTTITYTLQHGQYKFTKKGNESNDTDAYENFISHYIFVWGLSTKKEFMKAGIAEDRILVVGALKPFWNIKNKRTKRNFNEKIFCVALNGDQGFASNEKMLSIVDYFSKENDFKYYIRFHPKNKTSLYKKIILSSNCKGIVDSISMHENDVEFLVAHTSGIIVEAITENLPLFLFIDSQSESIHIELNVGFSNECELKIKVEELRMNYNSFVIELQKKSKDFNIANSFEDLKNNYQKHLTVNKI